MIVDGKQIAADIYRDLDQELRSRSARPSLLVFVCAPTPETQKYLLLKQQKAMALGVDVVVLEFDQDCTTDDLASSLDKLAPAHEGVILQLPFPETIDTELLLKRIPSTKDVDAINYTGGNEAVLPPVVGAIKEIAGRHQIDFSGQKVALVGQGRLVGKPASFWALEQNASVTVIDKDTLDADAILRESDIIISGAGVPGLITPDKIKEGAIIFDAGTSEEGGVLKGDADPTCASKCSLFTPVPGGIGPITIAILLKNLVLLTR